MAKSGWLAVLIAGLCFNTPAAAKIYKWVDNQGVTHYSETVPPEYANKDRTELDKSGRAIKKDVALTPEQRRAKEAADNEMRNQEEYAREQKRRDRALLDTYSNAEEIDLARDRNLQQVQSHINSASFQLKRAEDNLFALKKEAESHVTAGKIIPASLREDIEEAQARVTRLQQELEQTRAEKTAVEARFAGEKARYKELTGK